MDDPVELRAWAERVLFGTTLEDKLWRPSTLTDDRPGGAIDCPARPSRPRGLELHEAEAVVLPREHELCQPEARGRLLHTFANHELQALELMALCLLRFPEAPPAFRRGLSRTLSDEQRHLQLYADRMRALGGVELGALPLSGFLWRVMAPMRSPLDYVAHMALTFEQANLDFAVQWAATLRRSGDEQTAALLDQVHADEIGHVKLGLVWFERWRTHGPSLFEAHRGALRAPITPRRARGLGLDREGRQQAGLPADYVDQLACFEASRCRPPVVHLFDPTAELELAIRGAYTPSAATRAMTEDLELLPAFAATRDDVVLLRRAASPEHLRALSEVGLPLPECLELEAGSVPAHALPPRLVELRPWGWAPRARAQLAPLVERVDRPPPPATTDRLLHAKTTWAALRGELVHALAEPWLDGPETLGIVARQTEAAWTALAELRARGHAEVVLKAPFGTSGRNATRITTPEPTVAQRGWLERTLATQGAVLLEPWLDRVCDVSLRITVDTTGRTRIDDLGRFLTDRRGQYLGAVLGPLARAVPPVVARWLHDDGRDPGRLERVMTVVATQVGAMAHQHGYAGPLGIDGLVYRDLAGHLRLRPIVEVNVRPNLGHVVHGMSRRLARGSAGLLVVVRLAELPAGLTLSEAVARAQKALPTVMIGRPPRLRRGVVAPTDPSRARSVGTLLLVAGSRAEALRALEAAAPAVAGRVAAALATGMETT